MTTQALLHHADRARNPSPTLIGRLHKVLGWIGFTRNPASNPAALSSKRVADPKMLRSYENELRFAPWRDLQRNY